MHHARIDIQARRNARLLQPARVRRALVDQQVAFGQRNMGRRHTAQVGVRQRRKAPIVCIFGAAQGVGEHPVQRRGLKQMAGGIALFGREVVAGAGARIQQQLQQRRHATGVARMQTQGGGERAADTVSAHGKAAGPPA
ncbi:hypothetical protein D3C72_1766870 [compost metagenome]